MTYQPPRDDGALRDWLLAALVILSMIQVAHGLVWELRFQDFTHRMGEAADTLQERWK